MSQACPMNFIQIDSNASRITSALVSMLVIYYLITLHVVVLYFLLIDFIIRLFLKKDNSPLYMSALYVKELFKVRDKFVDSGAKRLAGYFGLSFVLFLIAAHFVNIWLITLLIAVVYLSCSLLDVFVNYCIGCKIYFIIKKIYPSFMN